MKRKKAGGGGRKRGMKIKLKAKRSERNEGVKAAYLAAANMAASEMMNSKRKRNTS